MFTFLSPLFLIGLAAAAIPLAIHLSRSRRQKKLRFSTTRFFTDQFLRSYRMSRLKEVGLLLARMALFALLAMALAQPIVMPRGGQLWLTGKRAVVLVIDDSASMGYVEDGVSLFERARLAGLQVVDSLRPGDAASVVLAARRGAEPRVLFPEPTTALADVRQALAELTVTELGTDLAGATRAAERVALTGSAQSREVYVLSDLQASGWEWSGEQRPAGAASDVLYFFVSIRPAAPENLAVTALQYAAARPMAGIPFAIRPLVLNQGRAVRTAEVSLFVNGRKVGQQRVDKLQPGRWATPLFHHTFETGGWQTGYVEVEDAGLTVDNRRYFAVEALDSIRALAVNGAPSQVAALDELFFLRAALAAGGGGGVAVDEVAPDALGAALATLSASGPSLVILANVATLPPAAVERLEQYVDQGGSLWVFLGDRVDPAFYNQQFAAPARLHGGLLPARLKQIVGDPAGETEFAAITAVDAQHPALAAFHDPKFANLAGIGFKALWELEPTTGHALAWLNTGQPLLCERSFGKGRALVFAAGADRDWTQFPVRPAFLPWVHRLTAYLAQRPLGPTPFYTTGQAVPAPVAVTLEGEPVRIKKPDGTTAPAGALEFTEADQIGVYEVVGAAQRFVANLDGYESDLRPLDEAAVKELLPGRPLVAYVAQPERIIEASLNARRGFKLWDIVLVIVLVIALLEPWIANRISLRHYTAAGGGGRTLAPAPSRVGQAPRLPSVEPQEVR